MRTVCFALLLCPATLFGQSAPPATSDSVQSIRVDSLRAKGQIVIVARDARTGRRVPQPMVCIKENAASSIPFWVGSPDGTYSFGGNPPAPIIHVRVLGPNHASRDLVLHWSDAIGRQFAVPLQPLEKPREPECGW